MFHKLNNLLLGSLVKQLVVGLTLVIASIMALFVWEMTTRQQAEEIKSHSQQVTAFSESAAISSAVWVSSRDYSGLQEIVQGFARYPALSYIIILDLKGQVLAHKDPSKIGLYLSDHEPNDGATGRICWRSCGSLGWFGPVETHQTNAGHLLDLFRGWWTSRFLVSGTD